MRKDERPTPQAATGGSDVKPLFVPLITKYYEEFKNGTKTNEYRIYGPRWNEHTCLVGRSAVLSKGYGKANRLRANVLSFDKRPARDLPQSVQADILDVFGSLDHDIAVIGFTATAPEQSEAHNA